MYMEGRISQGNPQYSTALDLVGPGNSMALGPGGALIIQQMSDRSYRVYIGIEAPADVTRPGGDLDVTDMDKARAHMEKLFANWSPQLRAFVAAAEGPWRPWLLYRMPAELYLPEALKLSGPPDAVSWTSGTGATLLGDAAHVTTPNGEGVNHAMTDAVALFQQLKDKLGAADETKQYDQATDAIALSQAVVAYEVEMHVRGYEGIQDSLRFENCWTEDGPERMLASIGLGE